ncbi:MAG: hypothetical protein ACREAA_17145 [Candidatus Polarisedimenticolia bacterium]
MKNRWTRAAAPALLLTAAAVLAACDDAGDPTAPSDSTVNVSANPQTVIVPTNGVGFSTITATVRSKNGTLLDNQEVTFSTTGGDLDPPADTFLTTDDLGQARSKLGTATSVTVTARSGNITGTTQVQTVPGNLATFILNVVPAILEDCTTDLNVIVEVFETDGDPAPGVLVIFGTTGEMNGSFTPGQINSDINGLALSTFEPNSTLCQQQCTSASADPNTNRDGICDFFITAQDRTNTFSAPPFRIIDNVQ